jgi:radical SAM superfamily enzyme YgiQ (UPF0313 family)
MFRIDRGCSTGKRKKYVPKALREAPRLDANFHPSSVKSRHALLINPFYPKDPHASFGKHVLTPTLALTSFAGATPSDWSVQYWDENLLQGPPPRSPFPQVVAITVHLTFAQRAFELAMWYRERGAKVLFGGLHVISCPEECRPHADAVVFGEGTQIWPEVLADVGAGKLKPEYRGSYRRSYSEDPPARRDLLDRRSFLTTSSVNATRGCHNRCGFCYLATDGLRMPYQCRDTEKVVAEIIADAQPYCVFTDNNLGSRPEYLRELCLSLRPLNIIWSAAVTLDVTDDPSLVREMALAGCTGVFIGFESLTDANITDARKKSPKTADYGNRVRIFQDNGIQVNGSFVLGFDHDRPDCFSNLVDWIEEVRMESATYHILTPYPGTPLFRQMESENRILHRDWSRYDTAHVVFRPKHMTTDQLAEGYEYCYERTFSHSCIWHRRPRDWRAAAAYLAMAYLYKRSNWLWPHLIRNRLTHCVWRPLLELSRWRHLGFRQRLEENAEFKAKDCPVRLPVYASV